MKIALDTTGTLAGLEKAIATITQDDGVKGLLLLSCTNNNFTPQELDPLLTAVKVPLFGGCFPGIVYGKEVYERGTLVVGLPVKPIVQIIENLSRGRDNFDDTIDASLFGGLSEGTMFVIVDGMSLCINSLLESIFSKIGLAISYIGGGAASLELKQQPCSFTNAGLKDDCAILAHVGIDSGIGVAHGMRPVEGPFKVTSSSFNTITTIEWQPAAKFYKDVVFNHPDSSLEKQSFIDTDAHYSLGLNRYDSERVIIEPIKVEPDDGLSFMMEVREDEFVDVMHVTEASMIQSAALAVKSAFDGLKSGSCPQTVITFDCVSRKLFLGNRFGEELEAICSIGVSHVGALTFGGEIGTSGSDFLDYLNRTCVVCVFEEEP